MRAPVAAALLAATAALARADGNDVEGRARSHFEIARGLYNLGNYSEAVKEFAAGYDLSKKPEFLVDLAQCYRKLGELAKAREVFEQYLNSVPATAPDHRAVEDVVREIDRRLADRPDGATPNGGAPAPATQRPSPPAVAAAAPPSAGRGERIAGIALLVLGVGALGGGLACLGLAKSTSDQIEHATQYDVTLENRLDLYQRLDASLLIVGGVAAVLGAALVIVGSRAARRASSTTLGAARIRFVY
jgi:tetratricopeptide (TPR) repeat protein